AAASTLATAMPAPLRATLVVTLLAAISALRGLRGAAAVGDALMLAGDRVAALEVMTAKTSRTAVGGALAASLLAATLWAVRPPPALLFAPMLGRWVMVVVGFSARLARAGAPGPRFEPGITFREFGWASTLTAGIALANLEAVGLAATLGVGAVAVALRLVWH